MVPDTLGLGREARTMPMYEYECLDCGITFERFQRFSDPKVDICPNGHSHVQRLLSAPIIIFKGSGFYITDYRSENYKKGAKKDSVPTSSPAKESKTSESKPAAKPTSSTAKAT